VRDAYLAGQVALDGDGLARVASTLTAWPAGKPAAIALVAQLSELQVRAFVPAWLDAWAGGDADAAELLRHVAQDRLVPLVVARARAGQFVFARLLRPSATPAIRALIELAAATAPRDVEHLREPAPDTRDAPDTPSADQAGDPVDPIAGKPLDELVALIDRKGVDKGLAVRAVHALTEHRERGVDPLERLTCDRRPAVRSAALRALRVVASRERTLEGDREGARARDPARRGAGPDGQPRPWPARTVATKLARAAGRSRSPDPPGRTRRLAGVGTRCHPGAPPRREARAPRSPPRVRGADRGAGIAAALVQRSRSTPSM